MIFSPRCQWRLIWLVLLALCPTPAQAQPWWPKCKPRALPGGTDQQLGVDATLRADLSALLQDAVATRRTEQASLVVLRQGRVLYRGGAGGATPQTIFDLASLTKVVATTPAVMRLAEQGKLKLDTPVHSYLPLLSARQLRAITSRQLLLHSSGLPSVVWAGARSDGRKQILPRIRKAKMKARPGARYSYSDTGFIVLGELAARLGGARLDALTRGHLFGPLGMCNTGFNPPPAVHGRVVSPWPDGTKHGQVYDPLAARLDGVAGHAGLFGSADDVARFGQMMLQGGQLQGQRVFTAATVAAITRPVTLAGRRRARGLGWDMEPLRGAPGAYGHTGYTGTSLWIDPARQLVVVLLTNRTRLQPPKSVTALRRRIANLVLGSIGTPPQQPVQTGLDRAVADGFAALKGRRVGLITNRAAVDRQGRWIVDLLAQRAPKVEVKALFVPEHGLSAAQDEHISDGAYRSGAKSIPVYSLFGHRRRPAPEALAGLDTLVFDVPTIGVRFYTYLSTLGWAMEEAARHKLRFVVLDRPDPLGGLVIQGPLSSSARRTSTNYHPLPTRYAMTLGEVARYFAAERGLKVKLQVIRAAGWRRGQMFQHQGLPWRNPSPNIRSWRQALLYAGVGMVEATNLSVGRGTDSPFQLVGAPWINGPALAARLNRFKLPGLHWVAASFTPSASRQRGKQCHGVRVVLVDPRRVNPVRAGVALAAAIWQLYPRRWKTRLLHGLLHHPPTTRAIVAGRPAEAIPGCWRAGQARFRALRKKYLLY